jgi:hypothetical protein
MRPKRHINWYVTSGGIPAEWEIQGNPPPRWTGKRIPKDGENKDGEIKREDFCVDCSFAQL